MMSAAFSPIAIAVLQVLAPTSLGAILKSATLRPPLLNVNVVVWPALSKYFGSLRLTLRAICHVPTSKPRVFVLT